MSVSRRLPGAALSWMAVLVIGMFLAILLAYLSSTGFYRAVGTISPVVVGLYALAFLVAVMFTFRVMNLLFWG